MKTLVIPDIHHRTQNVDIALEKHQFDEVVFLGDWFDSFCQPPMVNTFEGTCIYLRHLMLEHKDKDKFVFLLGNHDMNYIYLNDRSSMSSPSRTIPYYCSGYTANRSKKFRKIFYDQGLKDEFFINKFKPAHISQGWAFSHAGILLQHFPYGYTLDRFVNELLIDVWQNFRNLQYLHNHLLSGVGYCRGGSLNVGGVLWCDWFAEFTSSVDAGKQICGHTTADTPQCTAKGTEYECWNLDTTKHYGIIDSGILTIHTYD